MKLKEFTSLLCLVGAIALSSCGGKPALNGTWTTPCTADENGSTRSTFQATEKGNYFLQDVSYSDKGCVTPVLTVKNNGTYKVGEAVSGLENAYEFDGTVQNVLLTVNSSDMAANLDQANACGIEEWKTDVEVDVSGKKCGTFEFPARAQNLHTIYRVVKEGGKERLTFGDISGGKNGKAPQNRPLVLNLDVSYIKQ